MFVDVCMRVYCFLEHEWEGVGKSNADWVCLQIQSFKS